MDDKEFSNVFAIPANYTDSGKILGGMLEPRNAVEALVLIVLVGYPELMLIPMSEFMPAPISRSVVWQITSFVLFVEQLIITLISFTSPDTCLSRMHISGLLIW